MVNKSIALAIVAVVFAFIAVLFGARLAEENNAGYMQVKQAFPSGTLSVISDAGYFCQCLGSFIRETKTELAQSPTQYVTANV